MIAAQTPTGGVLSRTVNASACRPHWRIWVTSSQAAEVASRDSRFCHTLPDRPAHIHGGKVQRDCRGKSSEQTADYITSLWYRSC